MSMTVQQLRERLNDCGDGLEVRIDGREVLGVQLEGQQEHRRVNVITGEAAPDAVADGPIDGLPPALSDEEEAAIIASEAAEIAEADRMGDDAEPLIIPTDAPDAPPADDDAPR